MTEERIERRLAAVLAADVAGYSRLMEADEEGTLARLREIRRETVAPKIAQHHGRLVKTTGDGFLVEFASVVDAVRSAVEIQREMAARNIEAPAERRLEFRIGINLGDIIVEDDDIFGDGVNIAARLEALAESGGICISRAARDQVRDKLDFTVEDLGEQQVKNIARPVRAYALRPAGIASPLTAASRPLPALVPPQSIVVLPFSNLSTDPDQQYFADGLTEDVTTDLSRLSGTIVISRNTAFTYRNRQIDTRQIGRELSVRYVLQGSVRRAGNQMRINAQLINTETDAHLWAERFDRDTGDLFALQSDITSRIAIALNLELIAADAAHPPVNPDASDCILRARAMLAKGLSIDNYAAAINLYERALALDPQSTDARGRLAGALVGRVLDFEINSAASDLKRADELIAQALVRSPNSPVTHFAKAQLLRRQGRSAEAIAEYELVLASNRNWVGAWAHIARCKTIIGPIDEAIPLLEYAIRLSPRDPDIGVWYYRIGIVHLLQSRTDEAIQWFEKACSLNPKHPYFHLFLASAYALKGDTKRAGTELAEARQLGGEGSFPNIRVRDPQLLGAHPDILRLYEATYFAGLRKAGMQEG